MYSEGATISIFMGEGYGEMGGADKFILRQLKSESIKSKN